MPMKGIRLGIELLLTEEETVEWGNRRRRRRYKSPDDIIGYLSDELKEKYNKEFWETRKIFFDEFWNTAHCKGRNWYSNKTCWLKNDKWIYVDGAKMTSVLLQSGERNYNWEAMNLRKFLRDYSNLEIETNKLDKNYKSYKGFYIVLCCKEMGIFVFTSNELLEQVMKKGKPSSVGDIHWNVKPKNGGKEIWLIISSGCKIDITARRNNLDMLR